MGACPAHCRMFGSILGPYPLGAIAHTAPISHDNQKWLQKSAQNNVAAWVGVEFGCICVPDFVDFLPRVIASLVYLLAEFASYKA